MIPTRRIVLHAGHVHLTALELLSLSALVVGMFAVVALPVLWYVGVFDEIRARLSDRENGEK